MSEAADHLPSWLGPENREIAFSAKQSLLELAIFLSRPSDFRDFAVLLENFYTLTTEDRAHKSINVFFELHPEGSNGLGLSLMMEPWRLRVQFYEVRNTSFDSHVPGQEYNTGLFEAEDLQPDTYAFDLINSSVKELKQHLSFHKRDASYFYAEYYSNEELKAARG